MIIQPLLGPNGLMFSTENECGDVDILWGGMNYYSFNRNDLFAKKFGITLLAGLGVARNTICEFFKISRNTIGNIQKVFTEKGVEGLKDYKPGPSSISEEVEQFVIKQYRELEGTRGYQNRILEAVQKKVEEGYFESNYSAKK